MQPNARKKAITTLKRKSTEFARKLAPVIEEIKQAGVARTWFSGVSRLALSDVVIPGIRRARGRWFLRHRWLTAGMGSPDSTASALAAPFKQLHDALLETGTRGLLVHFPSSKRFDIHPQLLGTLLLVFLQFHAPCFNGQPNGSKAR